MKSIWLTYASLALNILLIGFLLGGALNRPPHMPFGGPHGGMLPMMGRGEGGPMSEVLDQLSEHSRTLVRDAFSDIHTIHKNSHEDVENVRKSIADAIGAAEWNPAALDIAEQHMQTLMQDNMKKSRARMRELLEKLTPAERKIIADHMRNGPPPPAPML